MPHYSVTQSTNSSSHDGILGVSTSLVRSKAETTQYTESDSCRNEDHFAQEMSSASSSLSPDEIQISIPHLKNSSDQPLSSVLSPADRPAAPKAEQDRDELVAGPSKAPRQTVRSHSHPDTRPTSRPQANRSHSHPVDHSRLYSSSNSKLQLSCPTASVDLIEEMYKLYADFPVIPTETSEPFRTIYPARSVLGYIPPLREPTPIVSVKVSVIHICH